MPYKSEAQRAFFHSKKSPVDKALVDEFDEETKGRHVPAYVAHQTPFTRNKKLPDILKKRIAVRRALKGGK